MAYSIDEVRRKGLKTLRSLLMRLRHNDQDGFADVGPDGKFAGKATFILHGLPAASPEELDDLFALAGIIPDPVQVNGDCKDCVFGNASGGDMGWSKPCGGCSRPKMTNFVALSSLKGSMVLAAEQVIFLTNVRDGRWWAKGLATAESGTKEYHTQLTAVRRIEEKMKKRLMIVDTLHGRRLTNKGALAIERYQNA